MLGSLPHLPQQDHLGHHHQLLQHEQHHQYQVDQGVEHLLHLADLDLEIFHHHLFLRKYIFTLSCVPYRMSHAEFLHVIENPRIFALAENDIRVSHIHVIKILVIDRLCN